MSISNITSLARFIVVENHLSGPVPSLRNLHNLQHFGINQNNLGSRGYSDLSFISDLINARVRAMETWMSGCIQLLKHKRIHTLPSNVLLDNDLTMHVSDFGLARFVLKPTDNAPTNHQTSSIGIRGSVGYAAPEYGMGSEVSTYGDVYNFGILLLEMFTGKRLTDNMFSDGFNLHNFVKTVYLERATAIADLLLLQRGAKDTPNDQCSSRAQKLEECLSLTFGIGIACSAESPTDRKDISGVASELRSIRNNLPA